MLWTTSNRIPNNGLNKNTSSYPPEQGVWKSGSQGWVIKLTTTSGTLALSILPLLHLWHVGLQSLGLVSHGCVMAVVVPDTTCLHHRPQARWRGAGTSLTTAPFFIREENFTLNSLTHFSLNLIWQEWMAWPPVAIRDTGQVGIQHFSHWHWMLALPGRKQRRRRTGPTYTVSAHLQRLEVDRADSHFKKHVPFIPQYAEA